MGLSLSWIAACAPSATVLEYLDLRDTGDRGRAATDEIVGLPLANGAYLVCINGFGHPIIEPYSLEPLSMRGRIVGCTLSENTNASAAFEFATGKLVWRVTHFLHKGDNDIALEGSVPESYAPLVAAAEHAHEQEGHDAMFSVPVDLAAEVGGYRWDAMTDAPYSVLVPREIVEFEASPSIWRKAVRMERANQLVRTHGKPGKYLGKYLRAPLHKLGLTREFKTEDRVVFDRDIDIGAQRILLEPSLGAVDVSFALECKPVEAVIDGFGKRLARLSPWTFGLSLGFLEKRSSIFYNYHSAEEMEALAKSLAMRIPWWLQEVSTIRGLDRVLQQQRKSGVKLGDPRRRFAELALAHLAGHSDLHVLVRELAPDETQRAKLDEFVDYLRNERNLSA